MNPMIVYAEQNATPRAEYYNEDGKIKVHPTWYETDGNIINAEINNIDRFIPKLKFLAYDGKFISGTMTYLNYNDMVIGDFDLQWMFVPDDAIYETRTGVFHFYLWPPDTEKQKGKIQEDTGIVEEVTATSLTATMVQLDTMTAYDINLNNKISGSTYSWTSSDESVATVDSKNGKVRAKKEGKAIITCEIINPDGTTSTLASEVTVGYDDNAPLLTETSLDLNPGDVFDINLENKIAKSKYRWASSDRSICKVNSSNGKVTAIGVGSAYVTCTITTPENQVIVLRCDISVTTPVPATE